MKPSKASIKNTSIKTKFRKGGKSPILLMKKRQLDREMHSKPRDLEGESRKFFNVVRARNIARMTFIAIFESIFITSKI